MTLEQAVDIFKRYLPSFVDDSTEEAQAIEVAIATEIAEISNEIDELPSAKMRHPVSKIQSDELMILRNGYETEQQLESLIRHRFLLHSRRGTLLGQNLVIEFNPAMPNYFYWHDLTEIEGNFVQIKTRTKRNITLHPSHAEQTIYVLALHPQASISGLREIHVETNVETNPNPEIEHEFASPFPDSDYWYDVRSGDGAFVEVLDFSSEMIRVQRNGGTPVIMPVLDINGEPLIEAGGEPVVAPTSKTAIYLAVFHPQGNNNNVRTVIHQEEDGDGIITIPWGIDFGVTPYKFSIKSDDGEFLSIIERTGEYVKIQKTAIPGNKIRALAVRIPYQIAGMQCIAYEQPYGMLFDIKRIMNNPNLSIGVYGDTESGWWLDQTYPDKGYATFLDAAKLVIVEGKNQAIQSHRETRRRIRRHAVPIDFTSIFIGDR